MFRFRACLQPYRFMVWRLQWPTAPRLVLVLPAMPHEYRNKEYTITVPNPSPATANVRARNADQLLWQ